jgi:hypothetical protein
MLLHTGDRYFLLFQFASPEYACVGFRLSLDITMSDGLVLKIYEVVYIICDCTQANFRRFLWFIVE